MNKENSMTQTNDQLRDLRQKYPQLTDEDFAALTAATQTLTDVISSLAAQAQPGILSGSVGEALESARWRNALVWYAQQGESCRKFGPDGDDARAALDADGGSRARAALAAQADSAWTGEADADAALLMLSRLDLVDHADDVRVDEIAATIRRLVQQVAQASGLQQDVEALLLMLRNREYAEHWAKTEIGQRLEAAMTAIHGELSAAQASGQVAPDPEIVRLAWQGKDLHSEDQPEYIICAELIRIADAARAAAKGE